MQILVNYLEKLKKYLDKSTNILSQPDKIQFQMIEGEKVINEAIKYLKKLPPIPPLEWEDALNMSAQDHVNDIGPKGILSYQSSDGTEPEIRITKYGNYMYDLGENIDFGPNDEIGVIIAMTLDDGEIERPHRENLFNTDYKKIGISCGPHKTEYQMCVMDFAAEFFPNKKGIKNPVENNYLDDIQKDNIDFTEHNAFNILKNSLLSNKETNILASINQNYNINNNSKNNISNNLNNFEEIEENIKNEANEDKNNNVNDLNTNDINNSSSIISKNNSNDNKTINSNNPKNNPPSNNKIINNISNYNKVINDNNAINNDNNLINNMIITLLIIKIIKLIKIFFLIVF